ncbi:UNVERIFIED_CONTAM: hypothetical protein FKN15_028393 [Acipenser sinensis]
MVLDKPSPGSAAHVQAVQTGQLVTVQQQQSIPTLKEGQGLVNSTESWGRKRKRKGWPNPLSCLKKKKIQGQQQQKPAGEKKKRNRHRKRAGGGGLEVESIAQTEKD